MPVRRISILAAVAMTLSATLAPLRADYDPIFDFIPLGGRSLLGEILAGDPPAGEARALLGARQTREEWVAWLKERAGVLPAVEALGEHELLTLADYLSFSMPLPADRIPADIARADWGKILPMDGRDMALEYCQSCHIITVTVTQDRTKTAWLGTMSNPSHVEIKLTPQQREALASYLVLNAGIPIDDVPEDLRAGGASY